MLRPGCRLYLCVLLGWLSPAAAQQAVSPAVSEALERVEAASTGPVTAVVSRVTGLVTFLRTRPASPVSGRVAATEPVEARARGLLLSFGSAFGLTGPDDLALVGASDLDEVGMEHARLVQTHRGVPVTGGIVTAHLRGADLVAVHARTVPDLRGIDVVPDLAAADAALVVRAVLDARFGSPDATLSEPRLELFNRGLLEGTRTPTRLAWFVEARGADLRELVWVDAMTGMTLLRFSQLADARHREVYDADDPDGGVFGDLPGSLVRSELDPPVVGPAAADANAAHLFSGHTYDYFFNQHGRDSYDDAGATLISTVRFCPGSSSCPFANAFWTGEQMVYGAGFSAADDVAAHELTHAVTEHTASLFYYMQSGALNESFSDIFGETVDLGNASGTDTPEVRWQIGEDLPVIGALRDMVDPTSFEDPGKMSDPEFWCGDYRVDGGGVHHNSGVPNHAFALMVDGGSYNGRDVAGIGLTKAGKIQYRALAHYLGSASDFLDNYHALIQSCDDLIGTAGITAGDCAEVVEALDAVEMSEVWPCAAVTQAAVPELCPVGQSPSVFAFTDFENTPIPACPSGGLPASWCTNGPESVFGAFATDGVRSGWGYDRPTAGNLLLQLTVPGTIPAGARLQFDHAFGFDSTPPTFWDGARIETSANGGPWTDAGGLIAAGQPYGGTVSSCCGNPHGGLSAFVGQSWGFTASQLDLSSFAGDSLAVRFNIGTDSVVDDFGWFLDNLQLYTCLNTQLDADGNGQLEALLDGRLILRYLFELRGPTLVDGAVDELSCARCTAPVIEAYLAAVLALLDIDGDGEVGALTDGVLILRYLLDPDDPDLADGAVDATNCTRCDAAAIKAYLVSLGG